MAGGVSADVTRLDLEFRDGQHRSIILREHGPTHNGHDIVIELAVLKALRDAGLATPNPLSLDDSQSILEHPYLLLEFVEGSTEIPAVAVESRIKAMADQLVVIHETPTDTLPVLPARTDPVPELLEFLPVDVEWASLRAKLQQLNATSYAGTPVLLHGDYWPRNVIWDKGEIAAVIDWEDAAIGDPLSDVACACLELRYIYGDRGEEQFKEAYRQHRELDPYRFALWQAYVAAAGYRSMEHWGLAASREATMRRIALETIRRTANVLGA